MSAVDTLTDRIRAEFVEFPGLKVTFSQACRLWQADETKCLAALEALVNEGFLRQSASGAWIALPKPQGTAIKAGPPDTSLAVRCPHCHRLNVVNVERKAASAGARTPFRCVACWRVVTVAEKTAHG